MGRPFNLSENRNQLLESIRNIEPLTDSLESYVQSWTFLPLEFNLFGMKMAKAPPKTATTDSYKAVAELIARNDTRFVTFDPQWLQEDVAYLSTLLSDKTVTAKVRKEFAREARVEDLAFDHIDDEISATPFIEPQLRGFLGSVYHAFAEDKSDTFSLLDMRAQSRQYGPGRLTVLADVVIKLMTISNPQSEDSLPECLELVKGGYKLPRVLTYLVLLWTVYLAKNGYVPDPGMPEGVSSEESEARLVLNQVFMRQATSRGTRSFLSNGRQFLFFKVGKSRTEMTVSSIHNPDGTVDPYDGTVKPQDWTGQDIPLNAPRSPSLGRAQPHMLLAAVMASMRDRLNQTSPSLLLDDDCDDPSSDGGTEREHGNGGDGEDDGTGGDASRDRQPGKDPEKRAHPQGERRSERLAGQRKTRGHQTLPSNANLCPQDMESQHATPDSAIQLTPLTIAMSNEALVTLRRPATLKGWHRFGNAMFDEPVHKVDLLAADPTPAVTPFLSSSRRLSPDHILLKRFISSGTLADVFAGSFFISQRTVTAAFKVMSTSTFAAKHWYRPQDRPFTEEEALRAFDKEASLLIRVNSLSLGLVPLFYGMWKGKDPHGYQHRLMGMELLGEEAHQNMSLEDKELVVACLTNLHCSGLTHGDVALRHFKRRPTSHSYPWAMIDLERSKERAASDVDFKVARSEVAELRRLLEL